MRAVPSPVVSVERLIWRDDAPRPSGTRTIPEETPIALTYGRATHAVMMATPADLDGFRPRVQPGGRDRAAARGNRGAGCRGGRRRDRVAHGPGRRAAGRTDAAATADHRTGRVWTLRHGQPRRGHSGPRRWSRRTRRFTAAEIQSRAGLHAGGATAQRVDPRGPCGGVLDAGCTGWWLLREDVGPA